MTIEEICDSEGVTLAYFDNDLWPRPGMIISDMRIIFVNKSLSGDAQKRVILHELGHLDHTKANYIINPIKCEKLPRAQRGYRQRSSILFFLI